MVDFKKMAASQNPTLRIKPDEIFDRLPKPQSFDDLHSSQAEVLDAWFSNRNKKDTVIKLNTGGGKTLIGLLIALSSARELKRGALYLVDNKQLVHQVCEQARTLGIPASNIMEENLLLQISEMAQRFSLPIIKPSLTASLPLAWRENPKRRKFQ